MKARWAALSGKNIYVANRLKPKVAAGFTIVELLIVVVVIAILAAITIVSYNGITQRASQAALQSEMAQAYKFLELYHLNNGQYPANLDEAIEAGLRVGSNTELAYVLYDSSDPIYYTLTGSDDRNSYYISSKGQTAPAIGAWITNYANNPGFETSATSTWGAYWSPNRTLDTAEKHSGSSGLRLTQVSTTAGRGDGTYMADSALPTVVEGATYRASFWYKGAPSTYIIAALKFNTGTGGRSSRYVTGNGSWQRVELDPYTVPAADANNGYKLGLQIILTGSSSSYTTPAAGTIAYLDDVMFQITPPGQVSVPSAFADGNTNGWSWQGTTNASTSYGPSIAN